MNNVICILKYTCIGLYRVENAWEEFREDNNTVCHNFDLIRQNGQTVVYEQPPNVSDTFDLLFLDL